MRRFWIDIKKEGNAVTFVVGIGNEVSGFMNRSWDRTRYNSWPPTHVAFAAFGRKIDYKFCLNQPGEIYHVAFFFDNRWVRIEQIEMKLK